MTSSLTEALGWTLLHSLWQASVVALVFYLIRQVVRSPVQVYIWALSALLVVMGWSIYSFVTLYKAEGAATPAVVTRFAPTTPTTTALRAIHEPASMAKPVAPSRLETVVTWINQYINFVAMGWLLGMVILSARLVGGLWYLARLRHHYTSPLPAWEATVTTLASRLHLRRPVTVLASGLAKVPMVIGHLKPLILLPVALASNLSPEQIEAIIAHELAHVCRQDYWINILQSLIEVIFFYHPAVQWLSSVVREEREKCCDDVAVSLCGDTILYAKALSEAESLHHTSAPLVLAFARQRGSLLARIERLVHPPASSTSLVAKVLSMVLILLLVTYLAGGDTLARKAVKGEQRSEIISYATSPQGLSAPAQSDKTKAIEEAKKMNGKAGYAETQTPGTLLGADTIPSEDTEEKERDRFSLHFGDSSFFFGMGFNFGNEDSAHPRSFGHWQFHSNDTFPDFAWDDSVWRESIGELGETMGAFSEELTTYLKDSVDTKELRRQLRTMRQELARIEKEIVSSLQSSDYQEKLEAVRDKLQTERRQLEKKLERLQHESDMDETLEKLNQLIERQREKELERPQRDSSMDRTAEDFDRLLELLQEQERAQPQAHTRMHNNFDATIHRLEKELLADGLIERGKEYRFELKPKGLYINRKKQKEELLTKYRDLLEIQENTSFSITRVAR